MNKFYIDEFNNMDIDYYEVIEGINNLELKKYIYYKNPYMVFISIIKALAYGKEVTLLDGDWSQEELRNQDICLGDIENKIYKIEDSLLDLENLYSNIDLNKDKFYLNLYTSGTTSKPKKIKHGYYSVGRAIKKHVKYNKDIWLFTFSPTHFAGLQVFLQAFLNQNTIIMGNDMKKYNIDNLIEKYNITKISATPTFYRYMYFDVKKIHYKVNNITLGGEKSDSKLLELLKTKFPNAKINNVYASTEAGSIFASRGEIFIIPERIKAFIKIDNNELLIHKDLMGEFDDVNLMGTWYRTGDIVDLISENKIKFKNRIGDFINVGGYKANPIEIEEELIKMDNITDAIVYPIKNSILGNIVGANVVLKEEELDVEKRIINELKDKLQKWKIPRVIKTVTTINKTNTGKKERK